MKTVESISCCQEQVEKVMTVEEIIVDAVSHMSVWQEMLYVFFFLVAVGAIACFISLYIVQWVGRLTFGETDNKKGAKNNAKTDRQI